MMWPSTRSDCLRAVGHILDDAGATTIGIEEGDIELAVHQSGGEGQPILLYLTVELQQLLESARARRGSGAESVSTSYEERLRAVGQDIDRKNGKSIRIYQVDGGFDVTSLVMGEGRIRTSYTPTILANLVASGAARRRQLE
jgi:hypothetical protein